MSIGIEDQLESHGTDVVKVTDCWYTEEESGQKGKAPIIHLCGRNRDGERLYRRVEGFKPRFYISEEEFVQKRAEIELELEKRHPTILDYEFGHRLLDKDAHEIINGVCLYTELPRHVGSLRDDFEKTWEGDVQFPTVFLKERGIRQYAHVPPETECHYTSIRSVDVDWEVEPRYVVSDIEVFVGEGGFPDYTDPSQPIIAISLYDSYDHEYWTGALRHDYWDEASERAVSEVTENRETFDEDGSYSIHIYDDEEQLVWDGLDMIRQYNPDILTGHNSDMFDYPYWFNRAQRINCTPVLEKLSPTGDVSWIHDAPRQTNWRTKGVQCWDAMTAFRKMQIHDLKSYSLESVANNVLGMGKEDIEDIDEAWANDPETFVSYNIRDVEAVKGYVEEEGLVDDYDNVKDFCGSLFGDLHHNQSLIDEHFLRKGVNYATA